MSTYLDIAISLIAVYIAFSLLVSWVNEQIATVLQSRGKNLREGITSMLGDASTAAQLYAHPIVAATYRPGKLPQYISSRQFSAALISYLGAASQAEAAGHVLTVHTEWAIGRLPAGSALRIALQSIYDQAGRDYGAFVHGLESWYDDQMDRVSGWYHQHATRMMILIAAAIVAALNVDTVHIVRQVSCQTALRAAISQPIAKTSDLTQTQIAQDVFGNMTFGWNIPQERQTCLSASAPGPAPAASPPDARFWLLKLLGLALTVVALALGAPFWFDLLKSIVNVRNAGNIPAPAQPASTQP